MKKILFAILLLCTTLNINAQDADTLPYQKYPVLPTFEVLELDSVNIFNTYKIPEGKPIVLIYFSPDCDHCVQLTEGILERIDEFKKARIYMFTPMSLPMTRDFYSKLNLKKYKNIKVGKDFLHFGFKFYGLRSFPFAAVYSGNKQLVEAFPKKLTADLLVEAVNKAKQ